MKVVAILAMAAVLCAQDKRGYPGPDKAPKAGDEAPGFKLKTLGAPDKEVELKTFKDKKPVLLVFGSYT